MSKRFGRNQKRKMKEEIVKSKLSCALAKNQVSYLQQNMKDIVNTVESFCYNSAAIAPKNVYSATSDMSFEFRLPVNKKPSLYESISNHTATNYQDILSTVSTYRLRSFIESHKDSFSTKVHIKFGNERHVAYAISN